MRQTETRWSLSVLFLIGLAALPPQGAAQEQKTPPQPLTRSEAWSVFGYDPTPDFRTYDPQYRTKINQYKDEMERLRQEMYRQAKAGRKTPCARQIYVEAQWLVQYTADFDRIEKR